MNTTGSIGIQFVYAACLLLESLRSALPLCLPHSSVPVQSFRQCWGSGPDRVFWGLPDPDPDPLVRGTDPDPDPAPDPSLFSYMG
jgi:hypothetical protein